MLLDIDINWVEGEKLNTAFSKFNFQFCQQVATDALGADHTNTEYESSPLCRQNNLQLEMEFIKF